MGEGNGPKLTFEGLELARSKRGGDEDGTLLHGP